ncbi:MAG: TonB family protein [Polyangiaceae bacterium]
MRASHTERSAEKTPSLEGFLVGEGLTRRRNAARAAFEPASRVTAKTLVAEGGALKAEGDEQRRLVHAAIQQTRLEKPEPIETASRSSNRAKKHKARRTNQASTLRVTSLNPLDNVDELDEAAWRPTPLLRVRVNPMAWAASMALHLLAFGVGGWLMTRSVVLTAPVASAQASLQRLALTEDGELPVMLEASPSQRTSLERSMDVLAMAAGGEETARPDTERAGHGGEREVSQLARFLAQRDDDITLDKDTLSHLDRSQVARIKVSEDRASGEDRRALSEPMDLTFVAVGPGLLKERREHGETNPSKGDASRRDAASEGGARGALVIPEGIGEKPREAGSDKLGSHATPGAGLLSSKPGQEHRSTADTATAMPEASTGKDATLADTKGAARDNKTSEQEVSSREQALSHASTAGGELGVGKGGENGGKAPGSGGTNGPGSVSPGAGRGGGAVMDPAEDPRRIDYIRRLRARLFPLWANAFPRWAALEGRGGHVIFTLTIGSDGSLQGLALVRSSSIAEFDENVRKAVLRGAPFDPLPAVLGVSQLAVTMSFDAVNPAVR